MIDLMVQHGGWIDAASVGICARGVARGCSRASSTASGVRHVLGRRSTILWGGASGRSAEIVRMALERIDWPRDDPRWFWLLWRPLPGHRDLDEVEQADSRATFRLILERCDPNLRAPESGQTMLHEVIARDHGVGVSLATMLLDAGARTDIRDEFLKSTPLGWACRWGRVALVELLLARGADPIEAGAEPWATPLAWAERRQHAEIASILRQHGADRERQPDRCGLGSTACVTTLVLTNRAVFADVVVVRHDRMTTSSATRTRDVRSGIDIGRRRANPRMS